MFANLDDLLTTLPTLEFNFISDIILAKILQLHLKDPCLKHTHLFTAWLTHNKGKSFKLVDPTNCPKIKYYHKLAKPTYQQDLNFI